MQYKVLIVAGRESHINCKTILSSALSKWCANFEDRNEVIENLNQKWVTKKYDAAKPNATKAAPSVLLSNKSSNVEVLIILQPTADTLHHEIRDFLMGAANRVFISYVGATHDCTGDWVMRNGLYSPLTLQLLFKDSKVSSSLSTLQTQVSIFTNKSGPWNDPGIFSQENFPPEANFTVEVMEPLDTQLMSEDKTSPSLGQGTSNTTTTEFDGILNDLSTVLDKESQQSVFAELKPPTEEGFLKIRNPCIYVFPAGHGDSAVFAINEFNMLINGGSSISPSYWDLVRHLDRIDAVLCTHIGTDNLPGVNKLLERKQQELAIQLKLQDIEPNSHEYQEYRQLLISPKIGPVFFNAPKDLPKKDLPNENQFHEIKSTDCVDKMKNLIKDLNLPCHPLVRKGVFNSESLTLFTKFGVGRLEMFVLNPLEGSKELDYIREKWGVNGKYKAKGKTGVTNASGSEGESLLSDLASVCGLVVWQPADPNQKIVRVLFTGNTPQTKVLEGFQSIKHLNILRSPHMTKNVADSFNTKETKQKLSKANGVVTKSPKSPTGAHGLSKTTSANSSKLRVKREAASTLKSVDKRTKSEKPPPKPRGFSDSDGSKSSLSKKTTTTATTKPKTLLTKTSISKPSSAKSDVRQKPSTKPATAKPKSTATTIGTSKPTTRPTKTTTSTSLSAKSSAATKKTSGTKSPLPTRTKRLTSTPGKTPDKTRGTSTPDKTNLGKKTTKKSPVTPPEDLTLDFVKLKKKEGKTTKSKKSPGDGGKTKDASPRSSKRTSPEGEELSSQQKFQEVPLQTSVVASATATNGIRDLDDFVIIEKANKDEMATENKESLNELNSIDKELIDTVDVKQSDSDKIIDSKDDNQEVKRIADGGEVSDGLKGDAASKDDSATPLVESESNLEKAKSGYGEIFCSGDQKVQDNKDEQTNENSDDLSEVGPPKDAWNVNVNVENDHKDEKEDLPQSETAETKDEVLQNFDEPKENNEKIIENKEHDEDMFKKNEEFLNKVESHIQPNIAQTENNTEFEDEKNGTNKSTELEVDEDAVNDNKEQEKDNLESEEQGRHKPVKSISFVDAVDLEDKFESSSNDSRKKIEDRDVTPFPSSNESNTVSSEVTPVSEQEAGISKPGKDDVENSGVNQPDGSNIVATMQQSLSPQTPEKFLKQEDCFGDLQSSPNSSLEGSYELQQSNQSPLVSDATSRQAETLADTIPEIKEDSIGKDGATAHHRLSEDTQLTTTIDIASSSSATAGGNARMDSPLTTEQQTSLMSIDPPNIINPPDRNEQACVSSRPTEDDISSLLVKSADPSSAADSKPPDNLQEIKKDHLQENEDEDFEIEVGKNIEDDNEETAETNEDAGNLKSAEDKLTKGDKLDVEDQIDRENEIESERNEKFEKEEIKKDHLQENEDEDFEIEVGKNIEDDNEETPETNEDAGNLKSAEDKLITGDKLDVEDQIDREDEIESERNEEFEKEVVFSQDEIPLDPKLTNDLWYLEKQDEFAKQEEFDLHAQNQQEDYLQASSQPQFQQEADFNSNVSPLRSENLVLEEFKQEQCLFPSADAEVDGRLGMGELKEPGDKDFLHNQEEELLNYGNEGDNNQQTIEDMSTQDHDEAATTPLKPHIFSMEELKQDSPGASQDDIERQTLPDFYFDGPNVKDYCATNEVIPHSDLSLSPDEVTPKSDFELHGVEGGAKSGIIHPVQGSKENEFEIDLSSRELQELNQQEEGGSGESTPVATPPLRQSQSPPRYHPAYVDEEAPLADNNQSLADVEAVYNEADSVSIATKETIVPMEEDVVQDSLQVDDPSNEDHPVDKGIHKASENTRTDTDESLFDQELNNQNEDKLNEELQVEKNLETDPNKETELIDVSTLNPLADPFTFGFAQPTTFPEASSHPQSGINAERDAKENVSSNHAINCSNFSENNPFIEDLLANNHNDDQNVDPPVPTPDPCAADKSKTNLISKSGVGKTTAKKTAAAKADLSGGPFYVDLAYIPHHGNSNSCGIDFFKQIRSKYYVISGSDASQDEPSVKVLNALLEGKKSWFSTDHSPEVSMMNVTVLPTHDTNTLKQWYQENYKNLDDNNIHLVASGSKVHVQNESIEACKIEF